MFVPMSEEKFFMKQLNALNQLFRLTFHVVDTLVGLIAPHALGEDQKGHLQSSD